MKKLAIVLSMMLLLFVFSCKNTTISPENSKLYQLYNENHELVNEKFSVYNSNIKCGIEDKFGNNYALLSESYGIKIPYIYVTYLFHPNDSYYRILAYEFESSKIAQDIATKINNLLLIDGFMSYTKNNILYFDNLPANLLIGNYNKDIQNGNILSLDGKTLIGYCSNNSNVLLPNVEEIGSSAFECTTNIKSISMNSGLKKICRSAFSFCRKLEKVKLNDDLIAIDSYAFDSTFKLSYIVIPISVQYIGMHAFSHTIVYCEASEKPNGWENYFYTKNARVYYAGEWEYDELGIPKVIK